MEGAEQKSSRSALASIKHWFGYGWFMTFGTFLPLIVFLYSYVIYLTLIGEPVAKSTMRFGIWLSTFGQEPPGKEKLEARQREPGKKSIPERIRPYSPPGLIEKRGRPFGFATRAVWFVLVGWWLGAVWVLLAWSVFLAPYPFLDVVKSFLDDLPSVMTLAVPEHPEAAGRVGDFGG